MSKSAKNKKSKKIIAATGMALFSLVAVFTATIAWFATKKAVKGSGMSVIIKESGVGLSSLKAYRCILDKSRFDNLVFDGKDEYQSTDSTYTYSIQIDMMDYSTLSNMSPVLFLFDFTVYEKNYNYDENSQPILDSEGEQSYTLTPTWPFKAGDIVLSGSTDITAMATAPSGTSASLPLSNFVSFQSGIVQTSQVGTSSSSIVRLDSEGKVDEIKPSSILTQEISFASIDLNYDPDDPNHNNKYPFVNHIDVFNGQNESNPDITVHYLAVVMDYNQDVIRQWKVDCLDDNSDFTGNRVTFSCDFSLKL